jgi:hypothetical protein
VVAALRSVDGSSVGSWICDELDGGPGPQVKQQVPQRYDGYVRVFHPAFDDKGNPATWAEVASCTGRYPHRLMQWHCIVGALAPHSMDDADWHGTRPALGELEAGTLDVLCSKLAKQTGRVNECCFGLSTIHGGMEVLAEGKPLLSFPHREFVVLSGPLRAAGELAVGPDQSQDLWVQDRKSNYLYLTSGIGQAPNLMWPSDRSWFVSTEADFDSTLVGGNRSLINEILEDRRLEAYSVEPTDSLAEDADQNNCDPERPAS